MKFVACFSYIFCLLCLAQRLNAQSIFKDSAYVITTYSLNKKIDNDSHYKANSYHIILFSSENKQAAAIEKLLSNGYKKEWSISKWLKKIKFKRWNAFVNKQPSTSYAVEHLLNENLRNKIQKYDSIHTDAVGAGNGLISTASDHSFIKSYKIYCEGYFDTISAQNLSDIYYGPAKSYIQLNADQQIWKSDIKTHEVTKYLKPITVFVTVNSGLANAPMIRTFFEMKGRIIKEYPLVTLKHN